MNLQLLTRAFQHNWDHSATESPAEQRLSLIHKFIDLDEFPKEWVFLEEQDLIRKPTTAEIDTILRSWRSLDLRKKGLKYLQLQS